MREGIIVDNEILNDFTLLVTLNTEDAMNLLNEKLTFM